jgi:hypothetical protein
MRESAQSLIQLHGRAMFFSGSSWDSSYFSHSANMEQMQSALLPWRDHVLNSIKHNHASFSSGSVAQAYHEPIFFTSRFCFFSCQTCCTCTRRPITIKQVTWCRLRGPIRLQILRTFLRSGAWPYPCRRFFFATHSIAASCNLPTLISPNPLNATLRFLALSPTLKARILFGSWAKLRVSRLL